jgi:hypothetical protein
MARFHGRTPSGSMVVAIIALVVALSGTAVAATKLVNGDKLIKKNSLSGSRLRNHSVTGRQINLSALGKVPSASEADSASHAASADTATTATNASHATSADTATFATAAGTTLASGQTLKGMWAISSPAGSIAIDGAVAFAQTLKSAPTAQFVSSGSAPPNCPGTASTPEAAAGYVCVYEYASSNITSLSICNLGSCPASEPWGFQLDAATSSSGFAFARGSYAVTAA